MRLDVIRWHLAHWVLRLASWVHPVGHCIEYASDEQGVSYTLMVMSVPISGRRLRA